MKCERERQQRWVVRVVVMVGKVPWRRGTVWPGQEGCLCRGYRRYCFGFGLVLFCYVKFLSFHGLLTWSLAGSGKGGFFYKIEVDNITFPMNAGAPVSPASASAVNWCRGHRGWLHGRHASGECGPDRASFDTTLPQQWTGQSTIAVFQAAALGRCGGWVLPNPQFTSLPIVPWDGL